METQAWQVHHCTIFQQVIFRRIHSSTGFSSSRLLFISFFSRFFSRLFRRFSQTPLQVFLSRLFSRFFSRSLRGFFSAGSSADFSQQVLPRVFLSRFFSRIFSRFFSRRSYNFAAVCSSRLFHSGCRISRDVARFLHLLNRLLPDCIALSADVRFSRLAQVF